MPPFVIPIFIVHQGCPHRCIFCNQQCITGRGEHKDAALTAVQVAEQINTCLRWPRKNKQAEIQVAFYGGSFTGLPRSRQEELLGAVRPFLVKGLVHRIRLSTRPDYVTDTTPAFLRDHGVGIVELGVQSMAPEVLAASLRGHTVVQTEEAIGLLKKSGLTAGAQLMIGLPGESTSKALAGARRLASLQPDFVRIYPTLVIKGSGLAGLYAQGKYTPLTLQRAVVLSARIREIFAAHNIPVVRTGLQPSPGLEEGVLAGPYHPAFGELVLSDILLRKARRLLAASSGKEGRKRLSIAATDESIFKRPEVGSLRRLSARGLLDGVEVVFDPDQLRSTLFLR